MAAAEKYTHQKIGVAEEQAMLIRAEAECESIDLMSKILSQSKGKDIMRVKLIQQYISDMGTL